MNDQLRLKIEAYLGDSMSPEEALAFEQQMAEDPQLKEEVLLSRQANLHLTGNFDSEHPNNKYTQELRSFLDSDEAKKLKSTIQRVGNEHKLESKGAHQRRRYLLVAATVALLIVSSIGFFFLKDPGPEKLFAQYYTNDDLPSVITRDDGLTLFENGVLAFQDANFQEALEYFEQYENETGSKEVSLSLYRGATYLELNNSEAAIQEFDQVIASNSLDRSKGLWFKAMAYLKSKDETKAIEMLIEITEDASNFNAEEAMDILAKLK